MRLPLGIIGAFWLFLVIIGLAGWVRAAYAEPDVPAWAKAYHTCGTFGASADDCDPPKRGDLYAFCDSTWATPCADRALMLKDVCEDTIRIYTDGSSRFWCFRVDDATRDAYLRTLEPDKLANTFRAWGEGR